MQLIPPLFLVTILELLEEVLQSVDLFRHLLKLPVVLCLDMYLRLIHSNGL